MLELMIEYTHTGNAIFSFRTCSLLQTKLEVDHFFLLFNFNLTADQPTSGYFLLLLNVLEMFSHSLMVWNVEQILQFFGYGLSQILGVCRRQK
jgi:hypothetical protein